ncbi:Protein of unknown function [Frankineae bacterium MT45]|nr:Protein of unknown function [Frankineae bacterium MT45]
MTSAELLSDAFDRIHHIVNGLLDGLTPDELTYRVDDQANSIAWLVWHLTRVQDDHVADVARCEQRWFSGGWAQRFDLPFDQAATGYGQRAEEVPQVQVSAELLRGYLDEVHQQAVDFVKTLSDADLERVVDTSWDPPVTLGVRMVSVISDSLQHAGQAAYVRGIAQRRPTA